MPKLSAGILVHRHVGRDEQGQVEVLLVHPGGPYWAGKDDHAWSIPKGEYELDEDPFTAARREFGEELGQPPPDGGYEPLGEIEQSKAKRVTVWAVPGDFDVSTVRSNEFEMEWPPRSGKTASFPEIDRAAWFTIEAARDRLVVGQIPILDRLLAHLDA